MLFLGMTMRAWIKYAEKKSQMMKDAEEAGGVYISESDEDDYELIDINQFGSDEDLDNEDENVDEDGDNGDENDDDGDDNDDSDDDEDENTDNTVEEDEIDEEENESDENGDEDDNDQSSYFQRTIQRPDNRGGFIQRRGNKDGTKITITSTTSRRNELDLDPSPRELTKKHSASNITGFLGPDDGHISNSKKSSKSKLDDDGSVINYNINNNYYLNKSEGETSKQNSVVLEKNVSVSKLNKSNQQSSKELLGVPSGEKARSNRPSSRGSDKG